MLTTSHADGVTTIALDDGKANAMSQAMLEAIDGALDEAEAAGEVVLLVGREGTFSAGYDLPTFLAGAEPLHGMLRAGAELAHRMVGFPTPIVAACTGHAIAMGGFLLLASDYRVGADGPFKLGANEVRIKIAVPHWTVELFRDRVANTHASRTLLTGELYGPAVAREAGYLDEVVPVGDVVDRARSVAVELAEKVDLTAHRATKRLLREDLLARMRRVIDDEVTLENITRLVQAASGG